MTLRGLQNKLLAVELSLVSAILNEVEMRRVYESTQGTRVTMNGLLLATDVVNKLHSKRNQLMKDIKAMEKRK